MSTDDLYLPNDNLYLELDLFLDPPIIHFDELKKELGDRITEWNKLTSAPGTTGTKIKHMIQVAEAFRKRTAPPGPPNETSLTTLASEARKKREADVKKAIETYEEDDVLEQKEYDALLKEFKQFRQATIDSWLSLPRFDPPTEPPYPNGVKANIVAKSKMDEMAADLKIVLGNEKASLYDLLKVGPTATLETIQQAQKVSYDTASKKPKSGPESAKVDAEIRVLGQAKIIFKDEISRQGYDIARKRRPFDILIGSVFQRRAMKGSVTRDDYTLSIKETREEAGFSQAEAEWLVYEFYCIKGKFKPLRMQIERIQGQQCPVCNALNDINAKVCRCGIPLKINCPQCKREGSFGDKACTQCGFRLGDMPIALKRIEMAKLALTNKNIEEAEEHIRFVNLFWEDAPSAGMVRKALNEQKDKIKAAKQKIKDLESKIHDAIGKRFFYEARRLFHEVRQIPEAAAFLQSEEKSVSQTIAEVQKELARLTSVNVLSEKIELCEKILALASDCAEARTTLAQIPPLPPDNLVVTTIPTGIELKWTAPVAKSSLTFIIVRKSGGIPASVNDGVRLQDSITHSRFVDSTVDAGIVYGYAVFTQRDKTIEPTGCRSALVQKIDDVVNVSILPSDGSLTVSWKNQPGSRGMIVTRFTDSTQTGEGVRVTLQSETSFVDSNLNNATVYSYRIQTIFRGIDGKDIVSPGKTISAKPQVPPKAVIDLRANESGDGTTTLQWSLPPQGDVLLFDTDIEPDIPIGTVEWTTIIELIKRYKEPIPILGKGQTSWKNTSTGVRYLWPVTFQDGLAVFGKPTSVIKIADISNLDMDFSGNKLRLIWEWPKGLQKVQITYRHDQYPQGPDDAQSAKVILTRQEYDKEKSWRFQIGDLQEYFFCVYAVVEQDTRKAFSRGVRIQTVKTTIQYDLFIHRQYIFWGQINAKLILTIESRRARFPDLVVKKDNSRPPLNRDYGVPFFDIPAQDGQKVVVPLETGQLEEGTYIRIFVKNPPDTERYVIVSPANEKLQLCFKKPKLNQLYRELIEWFIHLFKRQTSRK